MSIETSLIIALTALIVFLAWVARRPMRRDICEFNGKDGDGSQPIEFSAAHRPPPPERSPGTRAARRALDKAQSFLDVAIDQDLDVDTTVLVMRRMLDTVERESRPVTVSADWSGVAGSASPSPLASGIAAMSAASAAMGARPTPPPPPPPGPAMMGTPGPTPPAPMPMPMPMPVPPVPAPPPPPETRLVRDDQRPTIPQPAPEARP